MRAMKVVYRKIRWLAFWNCFQLPNIHLDELAPNALSVEPLITDKLCLPPYEGPADHNDAAPLLTLVREVNPRIVLELGTGYGATVANICAISDAQVYTVNALPQQITGRLTTYVLPKEEIGRVYRKHGFSERVVQIYQNTKEWDPTNHLALQSIDLAIIDACHDADFVVNDFLRILPVLHERSIVLLHDVHPSMQAHLRDGYIACMYLRKLGFDINHLEGTWWGIWRAKHARSKLNAFQRFVNAVDNSVVQIRERSPIQDVLYFRWLANNRLPRV